MRSLSQAYKKQQQVHKKVCEQIVDLIATEKNHYHLTAAMLILKYCKSPADVKILKATKLPQLYPHFKTSCLCTAVLLFFGLTGICIDPVRIQVAGDWRRTLQDGRTGIYQFYIIDTNPSHSISGNTPLEERQKLCRNNYSHAFIVLALPGPTFSVLASYAGHYTLKEWMQQGQRLCIDLKELEVFLQQVDVIVKSNIWTEKVAEAYCSAFSVQKQFPIGEPMGSTSQPTPIMTLNIHHLSVNELTAKLKQLSRNLKEWEVVWSQAGKSEGEFPLHLFKE